MYAISAKKDFVRRFFEKMRKTRIGYPLTPQVELSPCYVRIKGHKKQQSAVAFSAARYFKIKTGESAMNHAIIGTAGHVNAGKTCLIKALTGIDTDRLKEEKKRGITIELGFAYLDFSDGQRVGIVDVPGHEKFVKNMLAGAGGIDIAMLVVAADEGIMPQTVEHLDILSILGVSRGVVVLTKTDLVETEFLELVQEDVRELTKGTFLEGAPLLPVSAYEGSGLEALKETLHELCISLPEKAGTGNFVCPLTGCLP